MEQTNTNQYNTPEEIRERLDELAAEYSALINADTIDNNELSSNQAETDELIGKYTSFSKNAIYESIKGQTAYTNMQAACMYLSYTVLATKDTKEYKVPGLKSSVIHTREIVEKERFIDLEDLQKFLGGDLGEEKKWKYTIQKFNLLLTCREAIRLGLDPKAVNDSFAMKEYASAINLGKTPTSDTQVLKMLERVCAEMIGSKITESENGEDIERSIKPLMIDVYYLYDVFTSAGKQALMVKCASHKKLQTYIMQICHRILMKKKYEVDYKKKKEQQ